MRWRIWLFVALLPPALALPATLAGGQPKTGKGGPPITWKKTVVDKVFRSEGVAVADVNKDGKADIIIGDCWYEAPDWKRHVLRADRKFDPKVYSEGFACFPDDFNGDGWVDVIVIPFPGRECYWYENPRGQPVPWKEHLLWHSACNETPIYADLFGTGKRVLVMGWQPIVKQTLGKDGRPQFKTTDNEGVMAWFRPGKDPTQPWEMHPISAPGKGTPGTQRFSHGLGAGDVNGDGRPDVICTGGWWEQPAKGDGKPWKFHSANLGEACADMYALDLDGDGRRDIISSSAHKYGMWWYQQQRGKGESPAFVRRDLFPMPQAWSAPSKALQLSEDEEALRTLVNKHRLSLNLAPMKADAVLCQVARESAQDASVDPKQVEMRAGKKGYRGEVYVASRNRGNSPLADVVKELLAQVKPGGTLNRWTEVGIGINKNAKGERSVVLVLGKSSRFYLMSETHALHLVDINGDGLKDLVTGRRWWSHGARGEPGAGDPAYLYWFEARRGSDKMITFIPHLIDDDSGVGTQFAVADINGDGIPDIVISNKKGVFVFEQVRRKE
ncbi:MAG: FG-GAP-like repeat-containing protein [Gemmataceae bacterium]|nr:FG-GAP-like repeat-containing protein [Gemmataceae bacterium]